MNFSVDHLIIFWKYFLKINNKIEEWYCTLFSSSLSKKKKKKKKKKIKKKKKKKKKKNLKKKIILKKKKKKLYSFNFQFLLLN